jgi:hypothetical protein
MYSVEYVAPRMSFGYTPQIPADEGNSGEAPGSANKSGSVGPQIQNFLGTSVGGSKCSNSYEG